MRRVLLFLLILAPILIMSQERTKPLYQISGKIVDQNTQEPLEDATIVFKNIESNGIEFGGISDEKGTKSKFKSKSNLNPIQVQSNIPTFKVKFNPPVKTITFNM